MKKIYRQIANLHGTTMMAVDEISIKDAAIVMTGNIMGTMPGSFYLTPEEMWKKVKNGQLETYTLCSNASLQRKAPEIRRYQLRTRRSYGEWLLTLLLQRAACFRSMRTYMEAIALLKEYVLEERKSIVKCLARNIQEILSENLEGR